MNDIYIKNPCSERQFLSDLQLHPALAPKHVGEHPDLHVPAHHGRLLSPEAGSSCWHGLDRWQVGFGLVCYFLFKVLES